MQVPNIPKAPDLHELLAADPDYAARYEQCLRDIETCKTIEELKRCKNFANDNMGYVREWTSHHGMLQRARTRHVPLSPELRSFAAFLVHVGPKPHYDQSGKVSIDKTNSKGYVIGEIRWENPEGQTRNRKTSRFHLYNGGYYTDTQIAALLTKLGPRAVKADTVKRRRLRGKTTAEQFAIENVPYESGLDPVSDWDFPAPCAAKMEILHRKYHRKGETRIAFFVRWLSANEIPRLDGLLRHPHLTRDQIKKLDKDRSLANIALHDARAVLKTLEHQRIEKEIETSIFRDCSLNEYYCVSAEEEARVDVATEDVALPSEPLHDRDAKLASQAPGTAIRKDWGPVPAMPRELRHRVECGQIDFFEAGEIVREAWEVFNLQQDAVRRGLPIPQQPEDEWSLIPLTIDGWIADGSVKPAAHHITPAGMQSISDSPQLPTSSGDAQSLRVLPSGAGLIPA